MAKKKAKQPSWDFRLGNIQKLEYSEDRKTASVTLTDGTVRQTALTFSDKWPRGAYLDASGKAYDIG